MNDLLNNIESAIFSQVIERGKLKEEFMYFEEYELEMDGEVYVADFCVTTTKNDIPEQDQYKIDIANVGICMFNEIKSLYPEIEVFTLNN